MDKVIEKKEQHAGFSKSIAAVISQSSFLMSILNSGNTVVDTEFHGN
jgi:hypothetical protein